MVAAACSWSAAPRRPGARPARRRPAAPGPAARVAPGRSTGCVGAGVGIVGVLVALWLLLPVDRRRPGLAGPATAGPPASPAGSTRTFPQPPDTVQVLRRLVGAGRSPRSSPPCTRATRLGPPPAVVGPRARRSLARVAASTVKVEGQACSRIYDGSGFAVGADLIVTNAHVVAGEPAGQTSVLLPSGSGCAATVVIFDPDRDLALLRVGRLGAAALAVRPRRTPARPAPCSAIPAGQTPWPSRRPRVAQEITAVGPGPLRHHDRPAGRPRAGRRLWPTATRAGRSSTRPGRSSGWPSPSPPTSPSTAYALSSDGAAAPPSTEPRGAGGSCRPGAVPRADRVAGGPDASAPGSVGPARPGAGRSRYSSR